MKISPLPKIKLRLCVGVDELRKLEKKLGIEENDVSESIGMVIHVYKGGTYTPVVYIAEDRTNLLDVINTLSHEATHIMQQYYEGLTEREPGREAQAYLVGNATQALVDKWLKHVEEKPLSEADKRMRDK